MDPSQTRRYRGCFCAATASILQPKTLGQGRIETIKKDPVRITHQGYTSTALYPSALEVGPAQIERGIDSACPLSTRDQPVGKNLVLVLYITHPDGDCPSRFRHPCERCCLG